MAESLVESLRQPEIYPEHTASVSLVETHLSWVFLTDQFAYKLLKPVRFEFVDFSSAELRRFGCEEEIRLNRRLAPDVYLQVAAVRRGTSGNFQLDQSAQRAIIQSNPLPALPREFERDVATIEFWFALQR